MHRLETGTSQNQPGELSQESSPEDGEVTLTLGSAGSDQLGVFFMLPWLLFFWAGLYESCNAAAGLDTTEHHSLR